jgi:hypothetical protein
LDLQQILSQPNTKKMYNNYLNIIQKEKNLRQKEEENTNGLMNIEIGGKRNYTRKRRNELNFRF